MPGDEPKPKRFRAVQLSLPQAHPYAPEAYLDDAANALRNCGNPVVLYDRFIASGVTGKGHVELMLAQAGQTLIREATAGVLFCAFAAEAYVNRFLAAMLSAVDFAAVDRLATVDKYVIAVPRADPDIPFARGEWPIGDLTRLFSMRNALVHHKPDKPPKDDITPLLLADFLIAVAEAARRLVAAEKRQDIRPMIITKDADHLRAWARKCMKGPPPPVGEDIHPPDLMLDAFRRHFGKQLERHAAQHVSPLDSET